MRPRRSKTSTVEPVVPWSIAITYVRLVAIGDELYLISFRGAMCGGGHTETDVDVRGGARGRGARGRHARMAVGVRASVTGACGHRTYEHTARSARKFYVPAHPFLALRRVHRRRFTRALALAHALARRSPRRRAIVRSFRG